MYTESRETAKPYRDALLEETIAKIHVLQEQSVIERSNFIKWDFSSESDYAKKAEQYRTIFFSMLGYPLTTYSKQLPIPTVKIESIGEDEYSTLFRVWIDVGETLTSYGILFLPKETQAPYSLVVALHGGGGTPEIVSSFYPSANYNDMALRLRQRRKAVFAPQLLLWSPDYTNSPNNADLDLQLKQVGGSLAALEVFKLMRSIDYLLSRPDIKKEGVGLVGLSYGGFYTLMTAAADTRIKASLSSCFFGDRFVHHWQDWVWFNAGNRFTDSEIASLICPRYLYVEMGNSDELFDYHLSLPYAEKVKENYEKLGLTERFQFHVFDGTHELDKADTGIEFVCERMERHTK